MPEERYAPGPVLVALVSLATDNIPTDIQGLLIEGDPTRGIRPGALQRALEAVIKNDRTIRSAH
jgi:hypothetical protein